MTMGENPAYRLRGVEVKEVSHRPPNPIKHNPAEISTAPIMKNTCDVDYHGIEEALFFYNEFPFPPWTKSV